MTIDKKAFEAAYAKIWPKQEKISINAREHPSGIYPEDSPGPFFRFKTEEEIEEYKKQQLRDFLAYYLQKKDV